MAFSELELQSIEKSVGSFCRDRSPKKYATEIRYSYEIEGPAVTLWEERPQHDSKNKAWTKIGIARFRYARSAKTWKLYWMRRDLKWHAYDPEANTATSIDKLVCVVVDDQSGAFFG